MLGPHPLGIGPLGYAGAEFDISTPSRFAQLLADPSRARRYAVVVEPWDVAGGATVPLYLISGRGGFTTGPDDMPADTYFRPLADSPYRVDRAPSGLEGIGLGQIASTTFGTIRIPRLSDDSLQEWLPPLREWVGRRISVYVGGMDFPFSEFGLIGRFTCRDLEWDSGSITATLDTVARRFGEPLPLPTYGGTGGLDGSADLKGKSKPWWIGQCFNREPLPVDPAHLIYSLSFQAMQAVTAVRDQGVALTDAGDVADITLASPAPGTFVTQLSGGWLRLGSEPVGVLTVDAQGLNTGGYAATPGALARRVLDLAAVDPAEIDAAALAEIDARAPYVCGLHVSGTAPSVQDALLRLMRSAGAVWGVARDGRITGQVWRAPGSPADAYDTASIISLKRVSTPSPAQSIKVNWRPNGRVQSAAELAGSLSAAQREPYQSANRVAEDSDAAVLTVHPYARTVETDTEIQQQADAEALLARGVTLLRPRRDIWEAQVQSVPLLREIGDTVEITDAKFGLAGHPVRIIGMREDAATSVVSLVLWG